MPYQGGKSAYPVQPPLLCRLGIVVPGAGTLVGFDVDAGVDVDDGGGGVDVDAGGDVDGPGFTAMLRIGVEAVPPQLTKVKAIKMNKQIFT
jgi:hypothetical protein